MNRPYAEMNRRVGDDADLGNTCLENGNESKSRDREIFPDTENNNDDPGHDRGNLCFLDWECIETLICTFESGGEGEIVRMSGQCRGLLIR